MNIDHCFPFRIISGFRPLKGLHIGHYAAVLKDVGRLQYAQRYCTFVFVADHHARSQWDEKADFVNIERRTREIAKQLLASGIDPNYCVLYRQSDVPELFEVMWFLAGVIPDGALRRGHAVSFHPAPSAGVYLYPLLMVADILSLKATNVAIGGDQKQHLELARDVARKLIRRLGSKLLPVPESVAVKPTLINGIDALPDKPRKMAAELNNDIPIFADEETILERIEKIVTRTVRWGEPLPIQDCNILQYVLAIGGAKVMEELTGKYGSGQYGYSDAKNYLKDLFFDSFKSQREEYRRITEGDVESVLLSGGRVAREQIARIVFELRSEMATLV